MGDDVESVELEPKVQELAIIQIFGFDGESETETESRNPA